MILKQLKDKDGDDMYSATILHESRQDGKFTTSLLDVRDGEATRKRANMMLRLSNRGIGSKYHKNNIEYMLSKAERNEI